MQLEALDQDVLEKFKQLGLLKFGTFKLKSGRTSNVYCDLRLLVSYPQLLEEVVSLLIREAKFLSYDLVCGVPYTALPMGTLFSHLEKVPMCMRRKEVKKYGTKKIIEGVFTPGQKCLVIEDVVTSGQSVMETVQYLRGEGLVVEDVITVINREEGGEEFLQKQGLKLHSLFTLSDLTEHAANEPMEVIVKDQQKPLSYKERASIATMPFVKTLFSIMEEKQSNLCFRLDETNLDQTVEIVEKLGSKICMLKSHVDLVKGFTPEYGKKLRELAKKHRFLIFEDRKFCDIGSTVLSQFEGGTFEIKSFADCVNAFIFPGEGVLKAFEKGIDKSKQGLLLMAQMSSEGNFLDPLHTQKAVAYAKEYKDCVAGFICQERVDPDPSFVYMTPGVKCEVDGDGLGQKYRTPYRAIKEQNNDVIIVGRGILNAEDPIAEAERYRIEGWEAYLATLL